VAAFTGAATLANLQNNEMTQMAVTIIPCLAAVMWIVVIVQRMLTCLSLRSHPLGHALAAFGDMEAVRHSVDDDFAGRTPDQHPLHIGRYWMCYSSAWDTMVQPIDAAVWAYCEQTYANFPLRKRKPAYNQLVLWMQNGTAYILPMTKHQVESSLDHLSRVAPWMNFGYSDKLKDDWNTDRCAFVEAVYERQQFPTRALHQHG